MITYKCLKCEAECCVEDELAGKSQECSQCGNINVVPCCESSDSCCDEEKESQATPPCISEEQRVWTIIANLGIFTTMFLVFGNMLVPLVIWLIKKHTIPGVTIACKQALNFQISMTIYMIVAYVTIFIFIGFFLLPAVVIFNIVCSVIAAIKASDGEQFEYPITIKFVK